MEYPLVYVLGGFFLLILFLLHSAVRNSSLFSPSPRGEAALAVNYYIISIISFPRVRLSAVWALRKNAHAPLFVFTDENNRAAKKTRARQKKCSLK
jgi:hypothetical protein